METEERKSMVKSLAQTAEILGGDPKKIRRAAKRLNCLIEVSGLEFVDIEAFELAVSKEAVRKAEAKAAKADKPQSDAQKLGLIRARLSRAPQLIQKKEAKIVEAEASLRSVSTNYERVKAHRIIDDLKAGLDKLQTKQVEDEVELDRILNGGDDEAATPAVEEVSQPVTKKKQKKSAS